MAVMGVKEGTGEAATRAVKVGPAAREPGFDFPFDPLQGVASDIFLLSS